MKSRCHRKIVILLHRIAQTNVIVIACHLTAMNLKIVEHLLRAKLHKCLIIIEKPVIIELLHLDPLIIKYKNYTVQILSGTSQTQSHSVIRIRFSRAAIKLGAIGKQCLWIENCRQIIQIKLCLHLL